jgi:hypothetical protein
MKHSEQDDKFDSLGELMHEFREACVHTAHREQVTAQTLRHERAAADLRADVRLRWGVPALAALAQMLFGGGWGAWWCAHPEHAGHGAPHTDAHVTNSSNSPTDAAAVSDEALLSAVQSDLSDRVPQALEPLAVSYTSNNHAHSGQEEMQ